MTFLVHTCFMVDSVAGHVAHARHKPTCWQCNNQHCNKGFVSHMLPSPAAVAPGQLLLLKLVCRVLSTLHE